jgi:hypothetical protein
MEKYKIRIPNIANTLNFLKLYLKAPSTVEKTGEGKGIIFISRIIQIPHLFRRPFIL